MKPSLALAAACASVLFVNVPAAIARQPATAPAVPAARPAMDPAVAQAAFDNYLAERFAALGERVAIHAANAAATDPAEAELGNRQAAAFLELARKLQPDEPRFARVAADLHLRVGDRLRAIEALKQFRKLDPADQLAQVQSVDLYLEGIETAEGRVDYLQKIVDNDKVDAEVRSHAAMLACDLLQQRGQDDKARQMLAKSLELNPQNLTAVRVRYELASRGGDAAERAAALAGLVESSPADGGAIIAMAHELSAVGAHQQAGGLYTLGLTAIVGAGRQPTLSQYLDYAAAAMLADRPNDARAVANLFIDERGEGKIAELHALRAASDVVAGKPMAEVVAAAGKDADAVYVARVAANSQKLNEPGKADPPATQPTPPLPDVRAEAERIKRSGPPELAEPYAFALVDLVTHRALLGEGEVSADLTEGVRTLLGDENPLTARAEGLRLLSAGQPDAARVKLSAIAEADPIARVGLCAAGLAVESTREQARADLEAAIRRGPPGMAGIYAAAVAKRNGVVAPPPGPESAATIELGKRVYAMSGTFIGRPQAAYTLTIRPLEVSHEFGQPILVELRLANVGSFPLAIGRGGALSPVVAIDASVRVGKPRLLAAVAAVPLTGRVRLMPRQSFKQVARVDRGALDLLLRAYPGPTLGINLFATSNPVVSPKGMQYTGGGQSAAARVIERRASPLQVESFRGSVLTALDEGAPVERARAGELLAQVVPVLGGRDETPERQALGVELSGKLDERVAAEQTPAVRGIQEVDRLRSVRVDPKRAETARKLATSGDPIAQAAAMVIAWQLPAEQRRDVARAVVMAGGEGGAARELADRAVDAGDAAGGPMRRGLAEWLAIDDPAATQPAE